MARIKSSGNKETELVLLTILKKYHITGWRRHQHVFGKPDFTFWKLRLVIFVDGCFWHGCPLHSKIPKNNNAFWYEKIGKNIKRDQLVTDTLIKKKWKVLRIWEHELKNNEYIVEKIIFAINN